FSEFMTHRNVPGRILATVLMLAIVAALLLQPDLGQTALVMATWAVLLFFSGISWWVIAGLGGAAGGLLFGAYTLFPHFASRINSFINPEGGNTYQVDRALDSLMEGGWFGRGPRESGGRKPLPGRHAGVGFCAAAGGVGLLVRRGRVL